MYDVQKAPPMIHQSQFPSVKVPVKLNAVNFDGVFNNLKYSMADQQTPQALQMQGNKMLPSVHGMGIAGQGLDGMQVQGLNV